MLVSAKRPKAAIRRDWARMAATEPEGDVQQIDQFNEVRARIAKQH
jgi:hypothetical protein